MAGKFDPYHTWLGIPPQDQPPNHYRLLGLEVLEKNRPVIEAAANRQMAYLQELSTGNDVELAQKLLGEVARARVCLLKPELKAAYDKKLLAKLSAVAPGTVAPRDNTTAGSDILSHDILEELAPAATGPQKTLASKKTPLQEQTTGGKNSLTAVRTILVAAIGILAILAVLMFRNKPLSVRVYEDKNTNGQYDLGEEVSNIQVDKVGEPGEVSPGFPTDPTGTSVFKLPDGTHKITIVNIEDHPYEIVSNAVQEVTSGGLRLFGPEIEFKLRRIEPVSIGGKLVTVNDGASAPVSSNAMIILDLNGNDEADGRDLVARTNAEGIFTFPNILARGDRKAQLIVGNLKGFKRPEPREVDLNGGNVAGIKIKLERTEKQDLTETKPEQKEEAEPSKSTSVLVSGKVLLETEEGETEGLADAELYLDHLNNIADNKVRHKKTTDSEGKFAFSITPDNQPWRLVVRRGIKNKEQKLKLDGEDYRDIRFKEGEVDVSPVAFIYRAILPKNANSQPDQEIPGANGGDPEGTDAQTSENEGDTETDREGDNHKEEPPVLLAGPETDPDGFLRQLGFEPAPDGAVGKEDKPLWLFKVDTDLPKSFNTAKSQYDREQRKEKWDENIARLNVEIATQNAYVKSLHSEAKNARSRTDRDRATESAQHADERLGKLQTQLSELQEAKNNMLVPLKSAAEAIDQEQQRYEAAKAEADSVKQAADKLGVKIGPVSKKDQKPWKEAALFNAEMTLKQLGLIKAKRGWQPSGLTDFRSKRQTTEQAKRFFAPYLQKKKQLMVMKQQGVPALQPDIAALEKQIDQMARQTQFLNARKTLTPIAESLIETINRLQGQRMQLEEKEVEIVAALKITGGNYKKLIKQYPSSENLEALSIAVSDLLQQVQN